MVLIPVLLNTARDFNESNKQETDVINTVRKCKEKNCKKLQGLGFEFGVEARVKVGV